MRRFRNSGIAKLGGLTHGKILLPNLVDLTKCSTYLKDDRAPLGDRFSSKKTTIHPQFVFYCQIIVEQQFAKYNVSKVGRITVVKWSCWSVARVVRWSG